MKGDLIHVLLAFAIVKNSSPQHPGNHDIHRRIEFLLGTIFPSAHPPNPPSSHSDQEDAVVQVWANARAHLGEANFTIVHLSVWGTRAALPGNLALMDGGVPIGNLPRRRSKHAGLLPSFVLPLSWVVVAVVVIATIKSPLIAIDGR